MDNSPAWILSNAMLHAGSGYADDWFHMIDQMPDVPEQCMGLFNTSPRIDGRLMKTGRSIIKPGVQLRTRAAKTETYSAGEIAYGKLQSLVTWLDTVKRLLVTTDTGSFMIHSVRQTSGVLLLGVTEDNLFECTLNVVLTLTKEG